MFLRSYWYVCALASELTDRPISRTILGDPIALFRNEQGDVVALADQCPHRGIHCHSVLSWATCWFVVITASPTTAPGCALRCPVKTESRPSWRYARIRPWNRAVGCGSGWAAARPNQKLPHTPWLDGSLEWSVVGGVAKIRGAFSLLVDNLMDLSHETFLHNGSIGTPEVAMTPIEVEVDNEARIVNVYRHMTEVECPPFYASTTGLAGAVDRWQDIEYFPPGFYKLNSRIAPVAEPPLPDGSDDHAFHMKILYGLTPSTETSVYDFWALSRDFCVGDSAINTSLEKMQITVVQEDVDALNIIQECVDSGREMTEVSVKIDRGGIAARHMLMQMGEVEISRHP